MMLSMSNPLRRMARRILATGIVLFGVAGVIVATIILVRAIDARGLPDLHLWHRVVLGEEFSVSDPERPRTFAGYLELEERLFVALQQRVRGPATARFPQLINRYVADSISDPERFGRNWNRSCELTVPAPRGGVLLVHGLTDSPYSLRTVADIFHDQGFYVLCARMPGHGTVPAALLVTRWQDWREVVRLAARHVRETVGPDLPLYVVGYSNGGSLAVQYAIDALDDPSLPRPDRVYLFSPALGVSPFGRFAAWHKVLSFMPCFEKFKWLGIEPEIDPFKYNSFPKNAGDQSYRITTAVQHQLEQLHEAGRFGELMPFVTFQSLVDSTVIPRDLVVHLYDRLASGGSELIVFDVNRAAAMESFLTSRHRETCAQLLARDWVFRLTVLTNASDDSVAVVVRSREPHAEPLAVETLDLAWPAGVYSLSHVAIPFPPDDPIYGRPAGRPGGMNIGSLELRGERGLLAIPADTLLRLRHNPFFAYIDRRLRASVGAGRAAAPAGSP